MKTTNEIEREARLWADQLVPGMDPRGKNLLARQAVSIGRVTALVNMDLTLTPLQLVVIALITGWLVTDDYQRVKSDLSLQLGSLAALMAFKEER